jgi:hypothetical protein
MLTGYLTTLPADVLLDTGVLFTGTGPAVRIGVTRGAPKWDPAFTVENLPFDGKHAPIKGLDRKFHGESKITATLLEFGPSTGGNQIAKLEPGSSSADSGTTPNTKTLITPAVGGVLYVAGNYLADARLIFECGRVAAAGVKTFAAILMKSAVITKWDLQGQDKDGAIIGIELVGRKDMASGTTADATYVIELYETIP